MTNNKFQRDWFEANLITRALKDQVFRDKLVKEPRQVYAAELRKAKPGQEIPDGVEIRIAVEDENIFYVVLPYIQDDMRLSDETLKKVAKHEMTHRDPCWGLDDAPE